MPFRRVFLAGMGGSSFPADLVNDYLEGNPLIIPLRDYGLPDHLGAEDLLIVSSFSGNTEETLSALEAGLARRLPLAILTHGGKIKEKALEKKLPLIPIPDCIQPRCANGHFFASILGILERTGLTSSPEKDLTLLSDFLKNRRGDHERVGRELSQTLKGRVPLIYGPPGFEGTCRVWKIKINENAKVQAFANTFPELNHNEMVGLTRLVMKPVIVYLRSQWMDPRIRRRMEVMQGLLEKDIPFVSLDLQGGNRLQEMFDSLAVADYATYYLAQAYGIDPAPVAMVEEFKKSL